MICFKKWRDQQAIKKWRQQYHILEHINNINRHYADVNGFKISTQARIENPQLELTYGEIQLESFLALISMTKPTHESVFYDLGCGLGKTVLACSQVFAMKKCYGVECMPELVNIAKQKSKGNITYLQQNILDTQWADATILFINVASFIPELWQAITQKIQHQPVSTIITCAKPLALSEVYTVTKTQVLCSWGVIPAYIHKLT